MGKIGRIFFWILFPLSVLVFTALMIFYFDLSNGPIVLFVLELIFIVLTVVVRILLRNKKFAIRMVPTLILFTATAILIPLSKPIVEVKSAAYYSHPVKTEVLSLKNGDVQGVYNKDKSVEIYAGIPYAQAPIGDLRWKEPQEPLNWEGVRDCSYFAPKSMQPESNSVTSTLVDIYSEKGWRPDYRMHPEQNMSEDSLYLNIWRPANDKKDLPILVFIHGGSLTTGSSAYEDYNGEEMAKKDVIMITITYRLGVFGYFAHEELQKESSNGTTGNYGLLDQIQALKWVNDNASYFGGDKNNITIAGESAGSSSVSAICVSPLAKGLFKRAIGESSSIVVKKAPHTFRKLDKALEVGQNIMEEFKCSSIEDLRKVSAKKLVNTKYSNSEMTLDGYALAKDPYQVYLDNENNEDSLLNGFNVMEADAFVVPTYLLNPTNKKNIRSRLVEAFGEDIADKFCTLYKDRIEEDAFKTFNEIYSVYWFMYPHYSWSKYATEAGVNVYRYQFTKENHYHSTYHAGEMIYAYGNVKKCEYNYRYDDLDVALSEKMLNYWANFAKNGNPNDAPGLPVWPISMDCSKLMKLGTSVYDDKDPYLDAYPIIEEFIENQLKTENE